MSSKRKVVVYIALSADGFIAKHNDDISFLSIVEEKGQDYGYGKFIATVDTVIVGRKTYDKVLTLVEEFPHANKNTYIITRTPRPSIGTVQFYTGSLRELITDLKSKSGGTIFVDGGAEVVHHLMKEKLVDEFYLSIIPVFLGSGIALFKEGVPEQELTLVEATSYPKGLVQLHYVVK